MGHHPHRHEPHATTPSTSRWSRHGWLLVLLAGAVLFLAVDRLATHTGNTKLIPTVVLLGAAVVPVAFVVRVRWRRLPTTVGIGTVAATTLAGGLVGMMVAVLLEFDLVGRPDPGALLLVGVIEESAKLIVPLAVLLAVRHRVTAADGLLLGVASGAGFAVLETMGYAFVALLRAGGGFTDAVHVLLLRGITSPAGHMAWTGLTVCALAAAAAAGWTPRTLLRFAATFAGAVVLHACWDYGLVPGAPVPLVVALDLAVAVLGLGALAVVTRRLGHRPAPVAEEPVPAMA